MEDKDIENLKEIVEDLEDAENGAMISLSREEVKSLKAICERIKSLEQENDFLKEVIKGTEDFKRIEELAQRKLF